jgi:hypothetical protein
VIQDRDRLQEIADFPWEVLDYERWAQSCGEDPRAASGDYLFSDEIPRFEVQDEDVLITAPDTYLLPEQDTAVLASRSTDAKVALARVSHAALGQLLGALDGRRTVAELKRLPGVTPRDLAELVKQAFGVLVFAPQAVAQLEAELSGIEITRFPGSPYEIVRSYWQNMIAVRARGPGLLQALRQTDQAVRLLQQLHVVALMGEDLQTYYRPASRISSRGIAPGALLRGRAETLDTPRGTAFLRGPRVNASLLGGELYHQALCALLGDSEATGSHRQLVDEQGLGWGRIVTAQAEADDGPAAWFCPPRPMQEQHWRRLLGSLAEALAAADGGDLDAVAVSLASFHQRFIRLHPFRCANQCLAMNLVNLVLGRSHGAGMPHQVLDHFALRLTEPAYRRLFAVAIEEYVLRGAGPVERYQQLAHRKRVAYAFIRQVAGCQSLQEALALVRSAPQEARLALFPV